MGALPASARPSFDPRASEGPPLPDPGLWETMQAGFRSAQGDTTGRHQLDEMDAYRPVYDALVELGEDGDRLIWRSKYSSAGGTYDREAIFAAVRRQKARGRMGELPDDADSFDEQWRTRVARGRDAAAATAARGNAIAGFAGGMAGAMTDPINIASLALGGGGATVARRIASEIAINAGVETILQPIVAAERKAQGRADLTLGEAAANVAFAGAGAGAIRGGFEIAPKVFSGARSGFERTVAANWERLPQRIRQRWTADLPPADTPEYDLLVADTTEAVMGRENLAEHEAAALAVMRREAEIEQASPFLRNGAGAAMHPALLSEAMRRILSDMPAAPRPSTMAPVTRPGLARATSIASTVVPGVSGRPTAALLEGGDAQARFMARVRRAESGGDDAARNPRSTAAGRYQFTDGTWLAYFKRRFPDSGLSDSAILSRKGNGTLQDTLMGDLTRDNAGFLQRQGEAVSEGNLYLVHFAGQGGARKLFDADPLASAEAVLGAAVVKANPHLRGMTAQGVIDWAHRAIGAKASVRAGARAEVAEGVPGADALQAEIDRITAQMAELERARGTAEAPLAPAADVTPPSPDILAPIDAPELQVRAVDAVPEDPVGAVLEPLRAIVAERRQSLNAPRQLAEALGVPLDHVAAGLDRLAALGEITVNRKTGKFLRKAPAPATIANTKRPRSLVEWIAENGGANDHGGELRALGIRTGEKRFGKKVIRSIDRPGGMTVGSGEGQYGLDTLFSDAVSAGYFPEHYVSVVVNGEHVDGPDLLLAAIADELAGKVRYSEDEFGRLGKYGLSGATEETYGGYGRDDDFADPDYLHAREDAQAALARLGIGDADDELIHDMAIELADLPPGMTADDAIYYAFNSMMERNQAEAFAYGDGSAYEALDYGNDPSLEAGYAAGREAGAAAPDRGRWEPADPYEAAGGLRGEGDGGADGGAGAASLVDLAPEDRAPFLDPDSDAAKAQADSLAHDAHAALDAPTAALIEAQKLNLPDITDPAVAERLAQEIALRAEAPMRGANVTGQEQDGTMGLGLFDAVDQPEFRLDAEGEAVSLPDLLADIDVEAADLKTIRDCM